MYAPADRWETKLKLLLLPFFLYIYSFLFKKLELFMKVARLEKELSIHGTSKGFNPQHTWILFLPFGMRSEEGSVRSNLLESVST
jgi:hypothetical protein